MDAEKYLVSDGPGAVSAFYDWIESLLSSSNLVISSILANVRLPDREVDLNMSQSQIIKAYGELHNTDFLLEAYYEIFMNACKSGVTTCFIERSPFLQNDTDEIMQSLAKRSREELVQEMNLWKADYDTHHDQRGFLAHIYICQLCALTGIKPVHVDVAARPLRLHIRYEAPKFSPSYSFQALKDAFEKIDLSSYTADPDCILEQLHQELDDIRLDLKDEIIWWKHHNLDFKRRLDEDRLVVDCILSKLDGNPAIIIYGKAHLDLERSNSIASLLAKTEDLTVSIYHIVGKKLVSRSEREVTEEAMDSSVMVEYGKSHFYGVDKTRDLIEATYWLRKASSRGSPEADYYLALYHLEQWELDQAFAFAHKAADQAHIKAFSLLGRLYYNGQGVPKNEVLSHAWYSKAAESGDLSAVACVAYNYLKGCGVPKNPIESFLWYSIALSQKDENAASNIKYAERELTPEQILKVRDRAADWVKQLRQNGHNIV